MNTSKSFFNDFYCCKNFK